MRTALSLLLAAVLASCFSVPPETEGDLSFECDPALVANADAMLTERLPVEGGYGKMSLRGIQTFSRDGIIIHYVRDVSFNPKTGQYEEDALYIADFSDLSIAQVVGESKTEHLRDFIAYENYRWIPPTTGQVVKELLWSALTQQDNSWSSTKFDCATEDRTQVMTFEIKTHTWSKKVNGSDRNYSEVFLCYQKDGRDVVFPYKKVDMSVAMPSVDNVRLSPDGELLFISGSIIVLAEERRVQLFTDSRVSRVSIDPSWSRLGVLYHEADGQAYLGMCDVILP
jgi:hypothetical protein